MINIEEVRELVNWIDDAQNQFESEWGFKNDYPIAYGTLVSILKNNDDERTDRTD